MRYVRFWLIAAEKSEPMTAIRGQSGKTGEDPELYEIFERDGIWKCLRWMHLTTDPDAHAFVEVASAGDCFACMVAAEDDARRIAEAAEAAQEDEDDH